MIAVVANGELKNKLWHTQKFSESHLVIAADGGANNCYDIGITPDYVIGDMDSIERDVLEAMQSNTRVKVKVDKNQDKTDLQLALELAKKHGKDITVYCAIGSRIDHTIANFLCIEPGIRVQDPNNNVTIVEDKTKIKGKPGDLISVIAISEVKGLKYTGLKWNVNNLDVDSGWIGISNELTSSEASISLNSGRILLIRCLN